MLKYTWRFGWCSSWGQCGHQCQKVIIKDVCCSYIAWDYTNYALVEEYWTRTQLTLLENLQSWKEWWIAILVRIWKTTVHFVIWCCYHHEYGPWKTWYDENVSDYPPWGHFAIPDVLALIQKTGYEVCLGWQSRQVCPENKEG